MSSKTNPKDKRAKLLREVVHKIQPMRIRIPDGSTLYLFGSILKSYVPNDLDILVVYDPEVCPPELAYQYHRSMVIDLSATYGLRVHATFLTPSEQRATDFISRTCAVLFSELGNSLAKQTRT